MSAGIFTFRFNVFDISILGKGHNCNTLLLDAHYEFYKQDQCVCNNASFCPSTLRSSPKPTTP